MYVRGRATRVWLRRGGRRNETLHTRQGRLCEQRQDRDRDGADEEQTVIEQGQPARDEPSERSDADEGGQRGASDDLDSGGADPGDYDRQGERELDFAQHLELAHAETAGIFEHGGRHGAQAGIGIDDQGRSGQEDEGDQGEDEGAGPEGEQAADLLAVGIEQEEDRDAGYDTGGGDQADQGGADAAAAGGEDAERDEDQDRDDQGIETELDVSAQGVPEAFRVVLDVLEAVAKQVHSAEFSPISTRNRRNRRYHPA